MFCYINKINFTVYSLANGGNGKTFENNLTFTDINNPYTEFREMISQSLTPGFSTSTEGVFIFSINITTNNS